MAELAHIILKKARESHVPKMQQWRLAQLVGVSEDTVKRWERGDADPDPDDVDRIEEALEEAGLWNRWMIAQYDSYRERYADMPQVEHIAADMIRMKKELQHVLQLIDPLEDDAIDGTWDDVALCKKAHKELPEAIAAMRQVLDKMPLGED